MLIGDAVEVRRCHVDGGYGANLSEQTVVTNVRLFRGLGAPVANPVSFVKPAAIVSSILKDALSEMSRPQIARIRHRRRPGATYGQEVASDRDSSQTPLSNRTAPRLGHPGPARGRWLVSSHRPW